MSLNSAFEKATLNHQPVMKSNTVTRLKSSPAYGSTYRITAGFLYAATSNLKRVTERIFTNSKRFKQAYAAKKFKTIGPYSESNDLIFRTSSSNEDFPISFLGQGLRASVADPDPGSGIGCFLTPGSGIRDPE